jgi:hypothetical protein
MMVEGRDRMKKNAGMADPVEVLRYRFGCPEKPPRAIRLPSIKPATGGDDIFAALK